MKSIPILLLCALATGAALAADGDPTNVQIFQRDANGRNKPIDMVGSAHAYEALGFDANGILGPLDILTQSEWTAQLAVLTTALGLKANLASPALTGTPTAPTATAGTSTTQIATTAFATGGLNTEATARAAADSAESVARAAADAAEAATRAAVDANKADLFHTHVSTEIADGGAVGLPLVRAQTAAEARSLIGPFVVADGDKGDITVSGTGATYTLDNDTVTMAKLANIAGASLIGRSGAGSGDPEAISVDPSYFTMSGASLSLAHVAGPLIDSGTISDLRLSATLQTLAGIAYSGDILNLLASTDYAAAKGQLILSSSDTPTFTGANLQSGLFTHSGELRIPSTAISSGVIDVAKREQTLTLTGTTTTLTLSSGTHQAGRFFAFELKGSSSGENTVTLDLTPDMISMDTRQGASVTQFVVPGSPAYVRCTIKDDGTNYLLYNDPGMNTGIVSIPTSRTTYLDTAETTVASASTTDIGAVASDHVSITGTTTINSFGTCAAGVERAIVFTGSLTVVHNATSLITPWGASIVTVAGATARVVSLGSGNWRMYNYSSSQVATFDNVQTFSGKTIDVDGNDIKSYSDIQFATPAQCDGTGAVRVTTEGATYGHATFSNSADKAANYVIYRCLVPTDLDTSVDLTAKFTQRLTGADTGKQAYEISMADVNSSGGADAPTFSNAVAINFAGDASGASGDIEISSAVTLTSWRSSLTAGHFLVIKIARDGDDGTNDTSTVNSNDMNLTIRYKRTQ